MLGENIRKYRRSRGLSQEELSEELGVSRQSISLWETGKTQPSIDILSKLAISLGVSIDSLLIDDPQKEEKTDNQKESYTEEQNTVTPKKNTKKLWLISLAVFMVALSVCFAFVGWKVFFRDFVDDPAAIERVSQSVVMLNCYDKAGELYATGSGFAMFEEDIIVTNYHVIADNVYRIELLTASGKSFNVNRIIVSDKEKDIAILKAETTTGLEVLESGTTEALQKGEKIVAIGSPLGLMNTVSTGIFSGYVDNKALQFTAPISNGSSGGALLDNNGKVLGITYASFEVGQNLNLAIPIEQVVELWQSRKKSNIRSVKHFYQEQTPTYSVEYILENYDQLDNRDFYIKGPVIENYYQAWRDEAQIDRREGWIEMGESNYGVVTIMAVAWRDSYSESGKILEKYDVWYGAGELLDSIEVAEESENCVIGPISRYNLENHSIRLEMQSDR